MRPVALPAIPAARPEQRVTPPAFIALELQLTLVSLHLPLRQELTELTQHQRGRWSWRRALKRYQWLFDVPTIEVNSTILKLLLGQSKTHLFAWNPIL